MERSVLCSNDGAEAGISTGAVIDAPRHRPLYMANRRPPFGALCGCVVLAACTHAPVARPAVEPAGQNVTTIVSRDQRLRAENAELRVVIRDVDLPDTTLEGARVTLSPIHPPSHVNVAISVSSNSSGMATARRVDLGEYQIAVVRVGYSAVRLVARLRPKCQQVLEVYMTRHVVWFDRCMVQVKGNPPCAPEPPPTPSRVVLTTCDTGA